LNCILHSKLLINNKMVSKLFPKIRTMSDDLSDDLMDIETNTHNENTISEPDKLCKLLIFVVWIGLFILILLLFLYFNS
jgi:hypothetical protein